ncbi:hypothetical protein P168DRAFT_300131 [Aspergillus campestris IBT 28561]|uniref:Protein kinase domain-containing protein n=1 Tax=Aspergillus campestris (strain IBT 28561) TaxID=1392248 RepID=A0A2I1CRV4_ASPC2|nr:uncharacterized protein P168DRAFT_300131 [Aspergillus campestris IBT 28561]PKY00347.1 hypothetical protein P168DRAFT_300131 [Aspergillus campestris IBT 28561]
MLGEPPLWFPKEFFFNHNDKSARITIVCKGKCFRIQLAPANFSQSPTSLKTYLRLMDSTRLSMKHDWVLSSFNPIFDQIEPASVNQRGYTLRDYLQPKTYSYSVYATNEELNRRIFQPTEMKLCVSEHNEILSKRPTKVFADGTARFLKLLDHDDQKAAIREMNMYKRIETLGLNDKVKVPRMYGVVQDRLEGRIIGLLLSWINCRNKTLACALGPETSSTLRVKWDSQLTAALKCLNEAGIVWGDVKAANTLIDDNEDAWIVDFGGGYTQGWMRKDQMETIEGDQAGLLEIKELLRQIP